MFRFASSIRSAIGVVDGTSGLAVIGVVRSFAAAVVVTTGVGAAVVTMMGFTDVAAAVVGVVLAIVAGDKEVVGVINGLDEVACTGLTDVGVTTVVVVVAAVEVVTGAAVVLGGRAVTVIAGLLGVDVLDACTVAEVKAIGVMVEGFVVVGVVTAV